MLVVRVAYNRRTGHFIPLATGGKEDTIAWAIRLTGVKSGWQVKSFPQDGVFVRKVLDIPVRWSESDVTDEVIMMVDRWWSDYIGDADDVIDSEYESCFRMFDLTWNALNSYWATCKG